ncbi:hypothetical protein FH972_017557 [Carpinus fangiana]|uniref:Alcohol dehydrogenase-like C-terminal domain-containing protein n=1 Tax=Carpinus fangiana TaxID=176857 RepID=A0A5N6RMP6_9ROSI|nr:hypothetical protein FH972_017557 [Carpinus fangiana]
MSATSFASRKMSHLKPALRYLICAGITVYNPLKYFGFAEVSKNIGVVGLGGLGHLAVKFAKAFGAKVTVISTSISKKEEALKHLCADSFLLSRDQEEVQAAKSTMDGIIDTVSASHPILPLIDLLKTNGKLVLLGAPEKPLELPVFPLLMGRKMVAGSATGGMKEIQEMVDFAAKHNITAETELIPMEYVNTAMKRLAKGDVKVVAPFGDNELNGWVFGLWMGWWWKIAAWGALGAEKRGERGGRKGRKMVAGSATGGMKEIQEMVDFAAKHNITAETELIPMEYVNTAMKRLAKGDVRYRFVIDVGNTLAATKP